MMIVRSCLHVDEITPFSSIMSTSLHQRRYVCMVTWVSECRNEIQMERENKVQKHLNVRVTLPWVSPLAERVCGCFIFCWFQRSTQPTHYMSGCSFYNQLVWNPRTKVPTWWIKVSRSALWLYILYLDIYVYGYIFIFVPVLLLMVSYLHTCTCQGHTVWSTLELRPTTSYEFCIPPFFEQRKAIQ